MHTATLSDCHYETNKGNMGKGYTFVFDKTSMIWDGSFGSREKALDRLIRASGLLLTPLGPIVGRALLVSDGKDADGTSFTCPKEILNFESSLLGSVP